MCSSRALLLGCVLLGCDPAASGARPEEPGGTTGQEAGGVAGPSSANAGEATTTGATAGAAPVGGGAGANASPGAPSVVTSGTESAPQDWQDSPPPPTGVVFEWPETDPAAASGACKPGHYVGEFSCRLYIIATEGNGAFDLSGTVDMQLEQTADGELLRIANGHFESTAAAAIPASGDIVGELRCSTSRFEARLENGRFSVALGLPVPFTEGTFWGPLTADYDKPRSAMINGDWDMQGELDGFPGSCMDGTWSAEWVP